MSEAVSCAAARPAFTDEPLGGTTAERLARLPAIVDDLRRDLAWPGAAIRRGRAVASRRAARPPRADAVWRSWRQRVRSARRGHPDRPRQVQCGTGTSSPLRLRRTAAQQPGHRSGTGAVVPVHQFGSKLYSTGTPFADLIAVSSIDTEGRDIQAIIPTDRAGVRNRFPGAVPGSGGGGHRPRRVRRRGGLCSGQGAPSIAFTARATMRSTACGRPPTATSE